MVQLNNRQAAMSGVLREEPEATRGCVTQQRNWRKKKRRGEGGGRGQVRYEVN